MPPLRSFFVCVTMFDQLPLEHEGHVPRFPRFFAAENRPSLSGSFPDLDYSCPERPTSSLFSPLGLFRVTDEDAPPKLSYLFLAHTFFWSNPPPLFSNFPARGSIDIITRVGSGVPAMRSPETRGSGVKNPLRTLPPSLPQLLYFEQAIGGQFP